MEKPDWWKRRGWPLFWRRLFFVTLPISGPIYALIVAIIAIAAVFIVIPTTCFMMLKQLLWDAPSAGPDSGNRPVQELPGASADQGADSSKIIRFHAKS
jgi:hypothetical protein